MPCDRSAGFHRLTAVGVAAAVVAMTAGVVVEGSNRRADGQRSSRALTAMGEIRDAFVRHHRDTGVWPANLPLDAESSVSYASFAPLSGLRCLYHDVDRRDGWSGPYLTHGSPRGRRMVIADAGAADPGYVDPWGVPYYLGYAGPSGPLGADGGVYLICAGPDGDVDTTNDCVGADRAGGDDLLLIISHAQ